MMVRKVARIIREKGVFLEVRIYVEAVEEVTIETRDGRIEEIVFVANTGWCHAAPIIEDLELCEREMEGVIEEEKKIIDKWLQMMRTLKDKGYLFEVVDRKL